MFNIDADPRYMFRVDRPDGMYPFGLRLRFACRNHDGSISIAKPVEMETVKPDDVGTSVQPMISYIPMEAAQMLMDELWNAGVRPGDIGTAGHLQATQQHLEDMRKLVGHHLGDPKLFSKT